jgi:predicted transposase/invertase (TIGR01784 family)
VGQANIVSACIVNPAQGKAFAADKLSILDVLAIDQLGRTFLIEMQISLPAGMAQRLTYCTSVSYAGQLREGDDYVKLRPSISICVLAGAMFTTAPKLHLDFRLREKSHPLTLTEDIQIHILRLRYLQVTAETVYSASGIERWAWFLCNADSLTLEDIPRLFPDPEFVEAAGILAMIAQTQEELIAYHARLKAQRDESGRILQAKMEGRQEGRQEALEQAEAMAAEREARGIALGEARGEARGELRGQITLLQWLLKEPVWTEQEFAVCNEATLRELADALRTRLAASGIR